MKRRKHHVPSYRLHKASGQAVVVINGHTRYLGKHGSKSSREAYARAIAEWSAQGRAGVFDRDGVTVTEVMAAYIEHVPSYYRKKRDDSPVRAGVSPRRSWPCCSRPACASVPKTGLRIARL